ncbi:hypothetical protein Q5P01_004052 [Channa striata]|uniref:Uncharacterized protein n=1 Tax=Channa striata TaxID=64152 RepID=A0AA88NIP5_CHASR|nr:hypothetical protein Q5P01_004052 [Channa striata]
MRPVVPTANPSGAEPVPLDLLDRILVRAVVAGWSHCVTLAESLTQHSEEEKGLQGHGLTPDLIAAAITY